MRGLGRAGLNFGKEWNSTLPALTVILKIEQEEQSGVASRRRWHLCWALRARHSFYTWSCVLGRGCFVGRTKKSTELGSAGCYRGPTWPVCVAVRSENVGDGCGVGQDLGCPLKR